MEDLWKFYGNFMESANCRKEAPARLVLLFGYMRIPIRRNGDYRGFLSAIMRYGLRQGFSRYEFRGGCGQLGHSKTSIEPPEGGYKAFCFAGGIRTPPKGFNALEGYYMYCVRGAIFVKYFLKIN